MIARLVLPLFGRLQRPLAWCALGYGVITFVGVIVRLVARTEPHLTAIGVASLILLEGYAAVAQVENELNSDAAVDDEDG